MNSLFKKLIWNCDELLRDDIDWKCGRGPVHVTTGSAGNKEKHDAFTKEKPPWSAFRSTDYGYTRLFVINATHMHLQQVSDDQVCRLFCPADLLKFCAVRIYQSWLTEFFIKINVQAAKRRVQSLCKR